MNIGTPELILIFAIALVVFGPQRLPDLMRQAARAWRQVKRMSEDLQAEFRSAVRELELEDLDEAARPPGYDPATKSVAYQPPDIPHQYIPPEKRTPAGMGSIEALPGSTPDAATTEVGEGVRE